MPTCDMVFLSHQILFKGDPQIKTEKQTADACPSREETPPQISVAKAVFYLYLCFMMFLMSTQQVPAADVWSKATFQPYSG